MWRGKCTSHTCFHGDPVSVVMECAVDVLVLFAPLTVGGAALTMHTVGSMGWRGVTGFTVTQWGRSVCVQERDRTHAQTRREQTHHMCMFINSKITQKKIYWSPALYPTLWAHLVMQKQCGVCEETRMCACGFPGPEILRCACCVKSTARSPSGSISCDSAAETPCGKTWCSLAPGT